MIFRKHYTREEARALLPQIRGWLGTLTERRREYARQEQELSRLRDAGSDLGGALVNSWVRSMVEIQQVLMEFHDRDIQIKDLERGLIDFPALMGDKEVFLCWEQGEEDVEYWHELDAGYAGREPL